MKEEINLNECPENLQESVNLYFNKTSNAELLAVQKYVTTPYKDKTIIDTTYKVFTLNGNLFRVYRLSTCSKEEWNDREVQIDGMLAGEIAEIVSLSPEWFRH